MPMSGASLPVWCEACHERLRTCRLQQLLRLLRKVFRPVLEGRPPWSCRRTTAASSRAVTRRRRSASRWRSRRSRAKDLIERNSIAVISGNLQFYTDMSNRVMQVFGELVPAVEKYSIDECFLVLTGIPQELTAFCQDLETHRAAMDRAADQHRHCRDQDPCQGRQPPLRRPPPKRTGFSISPVSAGATGRWR